MTKIGGKTGGKLKTEDRFWEKPIREFPNNQESGDLGEGGGVLKKKKEGGSLFQREAHCGREALGKLVIGEKIRRVPLTKREQVYSRFRPCGKKDLDRRGVVRKAFYATWGSFGRFRIYWGGKKFRRKSPTEVRPVLNRLKYFPFHKKKMTQRRGENGKTNCLQRDEHG